MNAKVTPATMRKRFDTLAAAANAVIAARDYRAENAAYPAGTVRADQCFDDWAADTLMGGFVVGSPEPVIGRTANSENPPRYDVSKVPDAESDEAVIADAIGRVKARLRTPGTVIDSPQAAKDLAVLSFQYQYEVFGVMFFDSQHCLIEVEQMFRGTLAQTSVYPREVVKRALELNAGAVVLVHNHPSGTPEPSRADEFLTQTLKTALALVDVRVLDHLVVGGVRTVSFAERGLL